MAQTLAELRAQSGPKPLPKAERTVTLIEGQHLLSAGQRLSEERADLQMAGLRTDDEGKPVGPPAKAGAGAKATRERQKRIDEIATELSAVADSLGDFQSQVGLVGIEGGEWQRFKDANPPREGIPADVKFTGGHCSFTAVFEALGSYVKTWNGEPVAEGDWDSWLAERITYADRRDMVTDVVMMHEQGLGRAPKLPNSSSETETSETD